MEKYKLKRSWAKPKLKKFLDEQGLFKQYRTNCRDYESPRHNKHIADSFAWSRTTEGYDFWDEIDTKYRMSLENG